MKEDFDKLRNDEELAQQKELLMEHKIEELKEMASEKNSNEFDELQKAGAVLIEWMKTLPEEEKEEISQEITLINQKLATDQLSLKNFIKGEFSLQHLLEVSDTLMEKIYQRAVYLQKRNHPMESAALFKFLILLNPFCADYWLGVGFSALNLHELEDAKQYFDTAISIDPKNPKVYYFAAICAKLQQDHDSVSKYCNEGQAVGSVEWDLIFKDLTKPFN